MPMELGNGKASTNVKLWYENFKLLSIKERQKTVSKFFKTVRHIGFRNSVYFQLLQGNYPLAERKIHLYTQFVSR